MTTAAVFERPKTGYKYHIEKLDEGADVYRIPSDESDPVSLVGKLRNGTVKYEEGMERFDPVVRRRLNEAKISYNNVVLPDVPVVPPPDIKPSAKSDSPNLTPGLNREVSEAIAWLRNKNDMPPAVESNVPPPPNTKRLGDKTPEYAEWLLRYKPEEFAAKYGVLRIGRVKRSKPVIDPETQKIVTSRYEEVGVISRRKTHLTLANDKHAISDGGDE